MLLFVTYILIHEHTNIVFPKKHILSRNVVSHNFIKHLPTSFYSNKSHFISKFFPFHSDNPSFVLIAISLSCP